LAAANPHSHSPGLGYTLPPAPLKPTCKTRTSPKQGQPGHGAQIPSALGENTSNYTFRSFLSSLTFL